MLVGDEYEGHHSPRFVTKAADDAYCKERSNPQTPTYFHGTEHLTIDGTGYVS